MIRSRKSPVAHTLPPAGVRARSWPRKLLCLAFARPRLISNLLGLVALFSIGFV